MRLWRAWIVALAAIAGSLGTAASARDPSVLHARPTAAAPLTLPPGLSRLTDRSLAYSPPRAGGPRPLIVLLHGAGGNANQFIRHFTTQADRRGVVLLAVQSTGASWRLRPGSTGETAREQDPQTIDAALSALFSKAPIDPKRVIVAGFSDGASYALWLGRANAQLFRGVLALSPGFLVTPPDLDARQRIFIAHGRRDRVIPFNYVRNDITSQLERDGYRPKTRWFEGGHVIDDRALDEGLDYLLAK